MQVRIVMCPIIGSGPQSPNHFFQMSARGGGRGRGTGTTPVNTDAKALGEWAELFGVPEKDLPVKAPLMAAMELVNKCGGYEMDDMINGLLTNVMMDRIATGTWEEGKIPDGEDYDPTPLTMVTRMRLVLLTGAAPANGNRATGDNLEPTTNASTATTAQCIAT